jgi:hypothetical protein
VPGDRMAMIEVRQGAWDALTNARDSLSRQLAVEQEQHRLTHQRLDAALADVARLTGLPGIERPAEAAGLPWSRMGRGEQCVVSFGGLALALVVQPPETTGVATYSATIGLSSGPLRIRAEVVMGTRATFEEAKYALIRETRGLLQALEQGIPEIITNVQ